MQRSKSHHWVPQFYLKGWTNDEGRLVSFFYGPNRGLVREPIPKNITCEDFLYTIFAADGKHVFGEENIFKRIDQEGADVLAFFLSEDWLNAPDDLIEKLYRFIYLLAVRHPKTRNLLAKSEQDVFQQVRNKAEACGVDASKFFEDLSKTYTSSRDRATLLMNSLAAFDELSYKELFQGTYRILMEAGDSGQFLTSDSPFVAAPYIGAKDAIYYFPLSPERVIVICKDKEKLAWIAGLPIDRFISYMNLITVLFANEYVYATSRNDEHLILEHLGGAIRHTKEYFVETLVKAATGRLHLGLDENTYLKKLNAQQSFERGFNAANLDEKLFFYTEAIQFNPNHAAAFYNRGNERSAQGDLEGALQDYTEAIRLNPRKPYDVAEIFNNRGVTHKEKGDLESAIKDYSEAIRLKPDFVVAFNNRGNARRIKGDLEGAIEDYNEVIRLNFKHAAALSRDNAHMEGDLESKDYAKAIRLKADYVLHAQVWKTKIFRFLKNLIS